MAAMGYPAVSSGSEAQRMRRDTNPREWRVGAVSAPCQVPLAFCTATLCPCCVAYNQRSRALHGDLGAYTCCGGHFPCSGRCAERDCPELCLACEVVCCFGTSVAVNRFMIQDELGIANSRCDNCLIGTQFALSQLACICSCIGCVTGNDSVIEIANALTFCADVGWCLLCGCLQAQQADALNQRDAALGATPMTPPRQQTMTGLALPPPVEGSQVEQRWKL